MNLNKNNKYFGALIQTELPEWMADFDVRGADPNSRIIQCALELEGSD